MLLAGEVPARDRAGVCLPGVDGCGPLVSRAVLIGDDELGAIGREGGAAAAPPRQRSLGPSAPAGLWGVKIRCAPRITDLQAER